MADIHESEVIIIGAGPAGWSAATFLARAGIKTLVIGDLDQSGLADASEVFNYVGFPKGVVGKTLLAQMRDQAISQGAHFISGEVTHVEKINDTQETRNNVGSGFLVRTAEREEFVAQQLLLAHGANFIKVNLPGEAELVGKGVHYCALCDGPLYKGKAVIVLGNGNLAAEEALQLVGMGATPRVITHALEPNISSVYQKHLAEKGIRVEIGKVEQFAPGVTLSIKRPDGVVCENADGVFIALGVASSSIFAKKLGLQMHGNFLKADENGRTNIEGVWTAGLARGGVNQIAKSVGEGAVAAVDIIKAVKGIPQYLEHA